MTVAYDLIVEHYALRCAKRSKVPLINHIDEGLIILDLLGENQRTKDAFAIHPMLQNDKDLSANWKEVVDSCDNEAIMLAMEYRSVANEYLSNRQILFIDQIRLSPIPAVNNMLIADKVQNYKDFITYHKGTHPRSDQLDDYFNKWLQRLNVSTATYDEYVRIINERRIAFTS
jgi:hypothetical protein